METNFPIVPEKAQVITADQSLGGRAYSAIEPSQPSKCTVPKHLVLCIKVIHPFSSEIFTFRFDFRKVYCMLQYRPNEHNKGG